MTEKTFIIKVTVDKDTFADKIEKHIEKHADVFEAEVTEVYEN